MIKKDSGDAILVFSNSWCAQCYTEKKVIKEFSKNKVYQNLISEVNVEKKPEISKKYHIKFVPTTIILKEGKVVEDVRHYLDLEQLNRIANYYFKENIMIDKKENKNKKVKFENLGSNLSSGVCGPDGCMIDWNKSKTEK